MCTRLYRATDYFSLISILRVRVWWVVVKILATVSLLFNHQHQSTHTHNEIIHHFTAFAATIATVAGYETTGSKQTVDILIDYIIKETPELSQNDVANWENGDTVTLQYVVNNNEESEITVVGVTGQFKNP